MSRWFVAACALLGAFLLSAGIASAAGPSVTAIVTGADKAPIAGVDVTGPGPDGVTGSGTTDAEGRATIEVPAAGQYLVTVDEKTLPAGETVKDGPERTVNVLSGDKKALFPVGVGG
ncbi:MAG: carboxypeptidase-like regulatory domain-containing protein, partial [bacterium]